MKTKNIKVAFVNQPWNKVVPPVQHGSIAIWTYEVARHLSKCYNIIVYANGDSGDYQSAKHLQFIGGMQAEGVQYRYVWMGVDRRLLPLSYQFSRFLSTKRPIFASKLYYFGYILQIAKDLRKQQCDIVHLQNFSQFIPIIRALNPNLKIVLHMHCEWLTQLDRTIIEQRLKKVDLIIGCSEYITDKICKNFPEYANRCKVLYNGVDIHTFRPLYQTGSEKENNPKRLLFVGRITPEKGLHVLLDAFQEIVNQYPDIKLEIIGPYAQTSPEFLVALSDDPQVFALAPLYTQNYLNYLKDQIPSNLKSKVIFSDFVPHSKLVSHYTAGDVLVNPSFSESFGMSLIEAMASGVPVVATRSGGMPNIVEEGKTGFLVDAGDVSGLARTILRLLSDDSKRLSMAVASRQRAVEMFSWETISEKAIQLYESINDSNE